MQPMQGMPNMSMEYKQGGHEPHGGGNVPTASELVIPDDPLLINPPRQQLLKFVLKLWCILFVLVVASTSFLLIVTFPMIAMAARYYFKFSNVWKVYHYSRTKLHIASAIVLLFFLIVASPIRKGIVYVLTILFS